MVAAVNTSAVRSFLRAAVASTALLALAFLNAPLKAQACTKPEMNGRSIGDYLVNVYKPWCERMGGRYYNGTCTPGPNWRCGANASTGGAGVYPRYDPELELQRREEADRQRRITEEQQQIKREDEQSIQRLVDEQNHKHQQLLRDRDEAVQSLKNSNTGGSGLKGLRDAPNDLGLKSSRNDMEYNRSHPDAAARDVAGKDAAWKQLTCATDILKKATEKLRAADLNGADFDTISYLAKEAGNAVHGNAMGVGCTPTARPQMVQDPSELLPQVEQLAERLGKDVAVLKMNKAKLEDQKQRLANASQHRPDVSAETAPKERPASKPPSPDDAAIAAAAAQQKLNEHKDDNRIKAAYEQQKANEKKKDDDLAEIREIQRQISATNAADVSALADVNAITKQLEALSKGGQQ